MDDVKKQLEKISDKLETIDTRINNIDKTLVKQEAQLAEHIRRTNLLEQKLEPIDTHVKMVNGAFKFIVILSLVLGIVTAIIKISP